MVELNSYYYQVHRRGFFFRQRKSMLVAYNWFAIKTGFEVDRSPFAAPQREKNNKQTSKLKFQGYFSAKKDDRVTDNEVIWSIVVGWPALYTT